MKIVRFVEPGGSVGVGLLEGDNIACRDVVDPIDAPHARITRLIPLASVRLLAPVLRPPKFLGVGLNFPLHTLEAGFQPPEYPVIFNKQANCLISPGDAIHKPRWTETLDYEGEIGVVIGHDCRHLTEDRVDDVIAGYVVLNDVSVRAWQRRSPTMTLAKSGETHGPVGPWLVTRDEIADPQALRVRTWIDDVLVQDFNTADMLFSIRHVVSLLSGIFTLERGDLIAMGTGDGIGSMRKPPRWLEAGETVTVEAEGLGRLINPVILEPEHMR